MTAFSLRYPAVLCFVAGIVSSFAMAPYFLWFLLPLTLSVFYIALSQAQSITRAGCYGFVFGFGFFLVGLYWVGNALLVPGNPYRWAWPLAVMGMPLMLAPFWAVAAACIKAFASLRHLWGFILFVAIFSTFEWLRGHLFTGFPWNLFAYTWGNFLEIAQIVALWDVYLLNILTIFWASLAGFLLVSTLPPLHKKMLVGGAVTSFVLVYAYGLLALLSTPAEIGQTVRFILVQPRINQEDKLMSANQSDNFLRTVKASYPEETPATEPIVATYIVWPESMISSQMIEEPWTRKQMQKMLEAYSEPAYLMSGAMRFIPGEPTYYNSLLTIDKNMDVILTYDKAHLVPFGEYMPLSWVFDIAPIVGFSGFAAGPGPQTLETPEGLKFSALICYEAIFPNKAVSSKGPSPDVLINVTNDTWFGISPGPHQHLTQARFRAIETGKPLIRVANSGISAAVDGHGRILAQKALFDSGRLEVLMRFDLSK